MFRHISLNDICLRTTIAFKPNLCYVYVDPEGMYPVSTKPDKFGDAGLGCDLPPPARSPRRSGTLSLREGAHGNPTVSVDRGVLRTLRPPLPSRSLSTRRGSVDSAGASRPQFAAPTAQPISAWGNAPRSRLHGCSTGLKARHIGAPHVAGRGAGASGPNSMRKPNTSMEGEPRPPIPNRA